MELSNEQINSLIILSAMDYGDAISPLGFHLTSVLYASLCNKNVVDVPVVTVGINPHHKYYIKKYYTCFTSHVFTKSRAVNADDRKDILVKNNLSSFVMGFPEVTKISRNIGDITIASEYNAEFYDYWCKYKVGKRSGATAESPSGVTGKNRMIAVAVKINPLLKYKFHPTDGGIQFTDSHSKKIPTQFISCRLVTSYVADERYQAVVVNISGGKMILVGQSPQSGINARAIANTPKMLIDAVNNVLKAPTGCIALTIPRCRMETQQNITELFHLWSVCLPEPFKSTRAYGLDINMSCCCTIDNIYDADSHFAEAPTDQTAKKISFDRPFVTIIRDNLGRIIFIGLCDGAHVTSSPESSEVVA